MNKKTLFIDTNAVNTNGTLVITDLEVKELNLNAGDMVVAYQDSEAWDATVVFENNKWGLLLLSDARIISNERKEGHIEGFMGCKCLMKLNILRVIEELNLPLEIYMKIKEKLEIK